MAEAGSPADAGTPILGPATQLGFVVRDLEAAMVWWRAAFGLPTFVCMERGTSQPAPVTYLRGRPVTVETKLAFGFIGGVQIELIEQTNDAPSPYAEFLAAGREGLQHLGHWVADHAAACARVEAAGFVRDYEIRLPGQDDPIVYFRAPSAFGPMLELVPAKWRRSREMVEKVTREASGAPVLRYDTYAEFLARTGVRFD
jgi:catechol 2,3-dioxygenase-like lactoylglutathione lyase family enzyme